MTKKAYIVLSLATAATSPQPVFPAECIPTTLPVLSEFQLAVAKRVVSIYESYAPFGLMTFVMSTYPILSASSEKLERIDILTMAQTYNKLLRQDSTSA